MARKFDLAERFAPVLYILDKLQKADMHKLFKILYFADREHLKTYGRSFSGEPYIAMANGPVPSRIYDCIRVLSKKYFLPVDAKVEEEIGALIDFQPPYFVAPRQKPNLDFLSKSAVKFLDESIEKYKDKTFSWLTRESHDSAWQAAPENDEMSVKEIAKAGGANDEMLKFIETTLQG